MDLKSRLESHPVATLKKEIGKTNIRGIWKKGITKADLINMMLKYPSRFNHIQKKEKKQPAPRKAPEPKKEPVKKVIKKPEPKKEEPKKELIKKPSKPNAAEFNLERAKNLLNSSSYKNKNIYQKNDELGFEIERILYPTRYTYSPSEGQKQEAYKILKRERDKISKEIEKDKEVKSKKAGETIKQMELADKFYDNLGTILKGSTRGMRMLEKDFGFSKEGIQKVFEGQHIGDFFPTPDECLKVYNKQFKEANNMLEGTAGLGSVVHYAERRATKITANELNKFFIPVIKKFNPRVEVMNKDFFNIELSPYDLIFLNPPFSKGGRLGGKLGGKDSKFYYNFLFHTIIQLNRHKEKISKNPIYTLLFISPQLTEGANEKTDTIILLEKMFKKMGHNKINEILKNANIKEISKSQYKELIEEGEIEGREDIQDLLDPIQIQNVGKCSNFGGTGITAMEYIITI